MAKDRIVSTVDPESRHAHKSRRSYRDGLKAISRTSRRPGAITADTLTGANTSDGEVATGLLAEEPEPVEALGDTAYGGGQTRADLIEAGHSPVIKPLPLAPPVPGGLDRDDFTIN
ncbi:MAG: transposase, partial [Egibacteraceae bacterium]